MGFNHIKAFLNKLTEVETPHSSDWVTSSDLGGNKRGLDMALGGGESTGNSSTTILTSGSTFTGTGEQNNFPQVGVMVKTDQTGVLYFDFSSDGVNWDSTFPVSGFKLAANIPDFHTAVKLGRYFRVRLVNDTDGDQTYLRLNTYYGAGFIPSNTPLNQSVGTDADAQIVRPNNFGDEVVIGRRPGVKNFTKFGYRNGLTANAGEQTIWEYTSGNFTPMTTASTFTVAYNNSTDGAGTTGALTLFFVYVDADGIAREAVHTLETDGSDVTSFTGLGINRIAVSSSGTATFNTNSITVTETTGGTVQAFMPATQSVTQQCIYHVCSNSDAVAKNLWINPSKASGGSAPTFIVKGYVFNRQFQTRFEVFRSIIDSSTDSFVSLSEPNGFALSPTDILYFVVDTSANSSEINLRFSLVEYVRA